MRKNQKQWQILFSWAPKSLGMVTATTELKDAFSLERKAMTNLDSVLESRNTTLLTKVHLLKALVFPVVCIYWELDHTEGNTCKSMADPCQLKKKKKAEHQRIDAFKPWCWRRLLRVPWTARRSNQSILKEINPENAVEGLML